MNSLWETIAFVLPNLSGGGAARVATILTREWAEMGHDVHLLTFEHTGAVSAYPVDQRITRHQIGLMRSPRNAAGMALYNLQRVRRLRKELNAIQPTIIISFLLDANVVTTLAARAIAAPVIISERNHPGRERINALKARIRAAVYPRADRLCVQTEGIRQWYADHLALETSVIPNPAPMATHFPGPPTLEPKSGRRYLAVGLGRLEPQKGYDRLIEAFALVKDEAPDWDLTIFGEGAERERLQARIVHHGLEERISLPGPTSDPVCELERADLFIHPSRFEGYPNAVIEALAAGLCVVATNCPGASGELLGGGRFGVLVPDAGANELAGAMLPVLLDHKKRCAVALSAASAVSSLAPDRIARRWLDEARHGLLA